MAKYISIFIVASLTILIFSSLLRLSGCAPKAPSTALIDKAKSETKSILDSLQQSGSVVFSNIKLNSEAFYKDDGKYIINYEISSGLDSSHITTTRASVFLIPDEGVWIYKFEFDKTYERVLGTE